MHLGRQRHVWRGAPPTIGASGWPRSAFRPISSTSAGGTRAKRAGYVASRWSYYCGAGAVMGGAEIQLAAALPGCAASVTRTPRALGSTAEYGLGLALGCGDTVGKRPPGEPADVVGLGSSPSVAPAISAEGTVGRIPAGSVAPRPVPVDVGVGVGDGEGECLADGFAVILMAPAAAG